jgi:hypothetical protein
MSAKSLKHTFQSAIADGVDTSVVRPSDWNADHDLYLGINAQTGTSYTFLNTDDLTLVTLSNAGAIAATLPQANGTTFKSGWIVFVRNLGVGTATITPTTSTIDGAVSYQLLTGEGATIVSDGTNYFALRAHNGIVGATRGGTGQSSYAIGDMLYASSSTAISKLADVATGNVLRSGGIGVAPAWGKCDLTTDVTGDLPFANLAQGSALSVLGVTGNATADVASIAAGTDAHVLRRSGTSLAFGTLVTASYADSSVTYAKIQNVSATDKLLGRSSSGAGAVEEITCTAAGRALIDDADAAAQRTTLGLGTSATQNEIWRSYLAGLGMSNSAGTPNSQIDVAAGVCRDDTDAFNIRFSASKTINCATTGANALDAGALANSTWYHAFAIAKADGTMASLASTSVSAPTMPSGYIYKRRIGSFRTDGSAHIIAFIQDGNTFRWSTVVADIAAANPGTSAVTRTLTVPTGVRVQADLVVGAGVANDAGPGAIFISDLSLTDQTAVQTGAVSVEIYDSKNTPTGTIAVMNQVSVMTNTSAQVRSRLQLSAAGITLYINTLGWTDTRGRDG